MDEVTEPVEGTEPVEPVEPVEGEELPENAKLHREAASYRVRLRETEAERDALKLKVEDFQRDHVERLADKLVKPSDMWAIGAKLADFLDDDGAVDAGKVAEYVDAVIADRPTWAVPRASFDGGAHTPADTKDISFKALFQGK